MIPVNKLSLPGINYIGILQVTCVITVIFIMIGMYSSIKLLASSCKSVKLGIDSFATVGRLFLVIFFMRER